MSGLSGQLLLAGLALMVLVLLFTSIRYRLATTALRRDNHRLGQALAELGPAAVHRQLEAKNAEVEAKNRELEALLYSVSHDLKSPLVTIRGFLGLIADDVREGDVERLEQDVARVDAAVEKMAGLLDDLLDRSRTSRPRDGEATDSRSTPPPPAGASPRSTP